MFHAHLFKYALWRGLPALLNLATVTLLTSTLSPDAYGVYALIFAGAALMNALLMSWAQQAMVRAWRLEQTLDGKQTLTATLAAGLTGAASLGVVGVAAVWFLLPSTSVWHELLPFVPLLAAAQALRLLLLELGRAQLRPDAFGALVAGTSLLTAIGAPAIAWWTRDAGAVILMLVAAELLPCAPVLWRYRVALRGALHRRHVSWSRLRELLRFGVPLTTSSLLAQGIFAGTRGLVAVLLGTAAAGMYAAAYDLVQRAVTASMQLVNLGTVPLVLDAQQRQAIDERDQLLRRNLVWSLLAGVPLALLLALLAEPVARTFLAAQYATSAAACIPWVVLGVLLNRLRTNHVDLAFLISGHTLVQLRGGVLGAGVALSLTWLLVPTFGVAGAAMATAIAYGVALVVNWMSGRAVVMLPWPRRDIRKLGGALVLPVLLLLRWQPAPGVSTGLTLALLLLTIAGWIVLADVDGLRQALRTRRARRPSKTPTPSADLPLPAHTPTRHFS